MRSQRFINEAPLNPAPHTHRHSFPVCVSISCFLSLFSVSQMKSSASQDDFKLKVQVGERVFQV